MSAPHTSRAHRTAQATLDSLPHGAVVLDGDGYAWQEGGLALAGWWYRAYGDGQALSSWELAFYGPITVLHPTDQEGKPND